MSVQGVTYMSAYNLGILKDFEEIGKLYKVGKVFYPECDKKLIARLENWQKLYRKD